MNLNNLRSEIRTRVAEVLREIPDVREDHLSFIKKKTRAISRNRDQLEDFSDLRNISWSQIPPAQRMELARRVARLGRNRSSEEVKKPANKSLEPNKKKPVRRKTTELPSPNKHPESENNLKPPSPTNTLAKYFPEEETKRSFSSRVGYFVSVSDVHYYTEEPVSFAEPRIEFDFEEEGGYLTLDEGTEWYSPWYSGSIIRGMDINVAGTSTLNYVKNSSFEL